MLTLELDKDRMRKAPSVVVGIEAWKTHAELAKTVHEPAEFIWSRWSNASQTRPWVDVRSSSCSPRRLDWAR